MATERKGDKGRVRTLHLVRNPSILSSLCPIPTKASRAQSAAASGSVRCAPWQELSQIVGAPVLYEKNMDEKKKYL